MLTDAGPLVALIDPGDRHHSACVKTFRASRVPLLTVLPALTEALHLLATTKRGASDLLAMIELGAVRIAALAEIDIPRVRELMVKYRDLPMDFADACLVRVAERDGLRRIFTTDRKHFAVYRLKGREKFAIVP